MANNGAKNRRYEAIGMLVELYLPSDNGDAPYEMNCNDTAAIAANIRKLAQLGRTDRWLGRIEQWARMVESSADARDLRWAFLQGLVYVNYAA